MRSRCRAAICRGYAPPASCVGRLSRHTPSLRACCRGDQGAICTEIALEDACLKRGGGGETRALATAPAARAARPRSARRDRRRRGQPSQLPSSRAYPRRRRSSNGPGTALQTRWMPFRLLRSRSLRVLGTRRPGSRTTAVAPMGAHTQLLVHAQDEQRDVVLQAVARGGQDPLAQCFGARTAQPCNNPTSQARRAVERRGASLDRARPCRRRPCSRAPASTTWSPRGLSSPSPSSGSGDSVEQPGSAVGLDQRRWRMPRVRPLQRALTHPGGQRGRVVPTASPSAARSSARNTAPASRPPTSRPPRGGGCGAGPSRRPTPGRAR